MGRGEPESATEDRASGFDESIRRTVVRSSAWVGVGYGTGQLLAFASMVVLVRLLDPKAFGVVAVGGALLAVVAQIQESGVGAALIHSRRDIRLTAPSAFVFATGSGVALTIATVALAPVYTHIVRMPEATPILQALALVLAIRSLSVVPGALIERSLDYKSRTKAELTGAVAQAAVAVACAFAGLGAWSLVAGQLFGAAAEASLLWLLTPWRPAPRDASRAVLREMLRYGRFVSGANIVNILNGSIDTMFVGRIVGAASLGAYTLAWRLSSIPNTVIGVIVGRVMFPVYARLQQDATAVRAAYMENLQRTLMLALPVSVALVIAAEPIVLAILGDQWSGAVLPLRILGVYGFVRLLTAPSGEVFKGIGRPHLSFAASLTFLAVAVVALAVLATRHGTAGAAFAMLIAVTASGVMAMVITLRVLHLRFVHLVRALVRPAACSALVGVVLVALLPATDGLRPWPALLVLMAGGALAFVVGIVAVGRPVVLPVWAALRRT